MTSDVLIDTREGVLVLTMNRPNKKNALTGPMYDAMTAALALAERDDAIRSVLLTGAGGTFTAGNDLGDFLAVAQGKAKPRAEAFIEAVALLDKPIVAAVDGVAVGVGTTMCSTATSFTRRRPRNSACPSSIWASYRTRPPYSCRCASGWRRRPS